MIATKKFNRVIQITFALSPIDRSNHPEVFYPKLILKNFPKFTGKHLCQSSFLQKVGILQNI